MMMKTFLATAAIAACQFNMAAACGWLDERCCHINPNDPNDGECYDARSVCWEGQCMGCGTNGKKACDSEPKCEAGNILNKDGWCSLDQSVPQPEPECDGGCPHGKVCFWGRCEDCGNNGQPRCDEGRACAEGLIENQDWFCIPDPNAPPTNPTCDGGCPHGTVCFWGECKDCGNNGQPKCDEGAACGNGLVVNADDFCETAPHCGWINEVCCPGDKCLDHSRCNTHKGVCMEPW